MDAKGAGLALQLVIAALLAVIAFELAQPTPAAPTPYAPVDNTSAFSTADHNILFSVDSKLQEICELTLMAQSPSYFSAHLSDCR